MRVLVTGAAGYVGSLLVERLLSDPKVTCVVATDRRPRHEVLKGHGAELIEAQGLLEDATFVSSLRQHLPLDAVVHAAFGVRAGYGRMAGEVERANIEGCRNVFAFCFEHEIDRLLYFSSAAVYGARPGNTLDNFFDENQPLREETYPYGAQKRQTELLLRSMYEASSKKTRVAIIRPCSITGPRFLAEPTKKITLVAMLKKFLPFIPQVSEQWSRQYIHEDDLFEATKLLLNLRTGPAFDSFNLAPNDYITAKDIADALGKRTLQVPAGLMSSAMWVTWHLSRGRMPTPSGSIDFYRYPINLDGAKITRLGFSYRYSSRECLLTA